MLRKDCLWDGGPVLYYDAALAAPPSTDSFALGYFARPRAGERVCDLGCGAGLLGLLLLARTPSLRLCGVEIDSAALELAARAYAENGWDASLRCGDLRDFAALPAAGSCDYCIANPPYFPSGSGASADGSRRVAREEVSCTLSDVCRAAAHLLRFGGRFALVHRPERMADVLCTLRECGIEPKRLRFVSKSPDAAPSLLLLEGVRGGKSGLTAEAPLVIGSAEWERVYFRS